MFSDCNDITFAALGKAKILKKNNIFSRPTLHFLTPSLLPNSTPKWLNFNKISRNTAKRRLMGLKREFGNS